MIVRQRQQDLLNETSVSEHRILVIGCGGIGSNVIPSLVRMGFETMQVWDKDEVDEVNLSSQNFTRDDVGYNKAYSVKDRVFRELAVSIQAVYKFWDGDFSYKPTIIITAVDSMEARIAIWDHISRVKPESLQYLIDARMSALQMMTFVCDLSDPESVRKYEDKEDCLYPSSEATQERCTAKAIMFTPHAIAYTIGHILYRIVNGKPLRNSYHGLLDEYLFEKK